MGTQEVGLTAGYLLPHRLTKDHVTKQQGPALMPSWSIILHEPVGDGWYRGQTSIGAEFVYIQFREPILTHGVGFTPKIKYTFVALNRLRPYVEVAGGPFWTDLGGQLSRNGAAQNPQVELDRRLLTVLEETNLFSTLYQSGLVQPPAGEKIVTGRLALSETVEPHTGGAAWRGFLIGASMFTLTPLLPLEYEYGSELVLELTRWDGQSKQYRSGASGTARYHLFGATPLAIDELKGQVLEQALSTLTQQLVGDVGFFLLTDTQLTDSTIRSIAVKPRASPTKGVNLVQDRVSR